MRAVGWPMVLDFLSLSFVLFRFVAVSGGLRSVSGSAFLVAVLGCNNLRASTAVCETTMQVNLGARQQSAP